MTGDSFPWTRIAGPKSGSAVLLIAGLGGAAAFWSGVQAGLSDTRRVLAYDQPGCGLRPRPAGRVCIETLAQDAAEVGSAILGDERWTVIGHSTGGAIAQALAAARPDRVEALVLSGTWLRPDAYMRALFDYRRRLLTQAPELSSGMTALLTRVPDEIDADALGPAPLDAQAVIVARDRIAALLAFDGTVCAEALVCPTLVLGAEDDRIVPPARQRALHAALPHSALFMLTDGGHFYPRTRAACMVRLVTDWLDRSGAPVHARGPTT